MASQSHASPTDELESLVQRALDIAKKARRHRQKLTSDNFYSNKLVHVRADAVNIFSDLSSQSAGDTSAMAELIGQVFSPQTAHKERAQAAKELLFALRTTWRKQPEPQATEEKEALFPYGLLSKTRKAYLMTVGRQMNGCFTAGWRDASLVMMRRLIEIAIIEAFERKNIAAKIKGTDGNYFHLSELVIKALSEQSWSLSRNARRFLPQLKEVGDLSAHGRYFTAQKEDIERVRMWCRVVVEEFLHHAELLTDPHA